jgi:hypothetical protein
MAVGCTPRLATAFAAVDWASHIKHQGRQDMSAFHEAVSRYLGLIPAALQRRLGPRAERQMPRLRLTHRADHVLDARPDRLARQRERPQRLPDSVVLASVKHPEQQMLSTDVIVAVTSGLRMGP